MYERFKCRYSLLFSIITLQVSRFLSGVHFARAERKILPEHGRPGLTARPTSLLKKLGAPRARPCSADIRKEYLSMFGRTSVQESRVCIGSGRRYISRQQCLIDLRATRRTVWCDNLGTEALKPERRAAALISGTLQPEQRLLHRRAPIRATANGEGLSPDLLHIIKTSAVP
jgi:hypothetical protein